MARFIKQVEVAIRVRQYSPATERSYLQWVRQFILFHGKRHPAEMGKFEVETLLTYLAVRRGGWPGVRDRGLLESAIYRAQSGYYESLRPG
jgi:hypothetical protein